MIQEIRDIAMTETVDGKHFFLETDMKGPSLKLDNTGKSILAEIHTKTLIQRYNAKAQRALLKIHLKFQVEKLKTKVSCCYVIGNESLLLGRLLIHNTRPRIENSDILYLHLDTLPRLCCYLLRCNLRLANHHLPN
ncbi:uncharacterized protein [Euphorbia lathyris]|uniref:uncharacterized protein isoform X3 n=1 Tax=Euphorbia lathyris TaxID=212925 RepID=UPI0033130F88